MIFLLACAEEPEETAPEGCFGPAVQVPAAGSTWTFRHPTVAWSHFSSADSFTVEIRDGGGGVQRQAETTADTYAPGLATAGTFEVTVTASPGGESCSSSYTVASLPEVPSLESAGPACGHAGSATETAWALAVSGDEVFTTLNAEGYGLCAHDADTLELVEAFGSAGDRFRSFGATAGEDGTLFFTTFPYEGECGDTLRRLGIVEDPSSREVRWVETGVEASVAVAVAEGLAFEAGLAGASCYGADSTCLGLDEPCPDGDANFAAWDLAAESSRFYTADAGDPGLAADGDRVYRAGQDGPVLVTDHDGVLLFELPLDAPARGLLRYDAPDGQFLLVNDFDQVLHVYELLGSPTTAEDLVEVTTRSLPDRYWQGAFDAQGRFYWPGQLTRTIARWDVR